MALPIGYTQVEYIKVPSGSYFDTNFIPKNTTKIDTKFLWDGKAAGYLYGAVDSNNTKGITAYLSASGGNWRFDGTTYLFKPTANTIYTTIANSTGLTVNGTFYKYSGTVSTFTALNTLTIGTGKNADNSISTTYFAGQIYYCKIYDNNILVRDFVPCVNSAGTAGFYDCVNNNFYSSASSTSFAAGGFSDLPDEYVRVEYIQSNGTQYIDTGFKPNNNTRIIIDMQCTSATTTSHVYFGSRTAQSSNSFCFWGYGANAPRSDYGSTAHQTFTGSESTNRLIIDKNKNVITYGTNQLTHATNTFQGAYNVYLFCLNTAGTANAFSSMKVFNCKIYDNNVLIRDFIPCRNRTSGVVGLYDLINGTFYTNKGTSTFAIGADIVPNYQVVNTTILDNALSATADAIRAKAEHSQQIAWNPTTGFADAIEAISSGIKVATGTFTPTARGESIYNNPITVSGLGFKPSRVIFFISNADDSCGIVSADTQTQQYTSYYYDEDEWEDEETGETVSETYYYVRSFDFDGELVITLNSDGFKISATTQYTNASGYNILVWPYYCDFTYIALGE